MNTIYKFPLSLGVEGTTLTLSKGAQVLAVQVQRALPFIWVQTPRRRIDGDCVERRFVIVVTGGDVPPGAQHHGTFQLEHDNGNFVGHVFELGVFEPQKHELTE